MEYNKIIAVTGLPGLYELLSSKSDGAIVRSLDDKTTRFVSSRIHNFSHLESIEVYTVRDNVNLVDILKAMEGSATKLPDDKDAGALKAYFTKVYPDLDFTRVYSSDLKKMVKWYSVLKANDIEIKLTEPDEEGVADEVAEDVDGIEDDNRGESAGKPAKKAANEPKRNEGGVKGGEAAQAKAAAGNDAKAASGHQGKATGAQAKPEEPAKKTAAKDATAKPAVKATTEKTAEKATVKAAAAKEAKKPATKAKPAAKTEKADKAKKTESKAAAKPKKAAKKK